MNQLNVLVWAWIESAKDLRRGRVLGPFLLLGAAQLAVLWLLTQFHRPGLSWFLAPVVKLLAGDRALHYPEFYAALPNIYDPLNIVLDWLLGSFLLGVGFLVVWESASGAGIASVWGRARQRYGGLLLVTLPTILLLLLALGVVPAVFPALGELRGNLMRAYGVAKLLVAALIQMLFVYSPLFLLVDGQGWRSALASGLKLAGRVPVATFLLVLIPNLSQMPIAWVRRRTDVVVSNLSPEMVAVILTGVVLTYVIVNYFVVASAARVYGARRGAQSGSVSWAA